MQAWLEYELAPLRALVKDEDVSNLSPGEGPRGRSGMFAPPRLLWRGIMASLQGLRPPAQPGPPIGQDEFIQPPHLLPGASMLLLCCECNRCALLMQMVS